jgi:signal transduction histidine kinase
MGAIVRWRFVQLKKRAEAQQELSRQLLESQEHERKRIGAGLHDSIGQNLLVMNSLAVMGQGSGDSVEGERWKEVSLLASQTLAEVREISYNLRPYHLDQLGLTGAVQSIISRVGAASTVLFKNEIDNIDALFAKEQEINVFRIVQESLNNIVKHAHAIHASVHVKRELKTMTITIADDGRGFDHHQQGFGLTSMAERVRILGGSLTIDSKPGAGTVICVTIPLPKDML